MSINFLSLGKAKNFFLQFWSFSSNLPIIFLAYLIGFPRLGHMSVTLNLVQDIADIVLKKSAQNISTDRDKISLEFSNETAPGYSMFIRVAKSLE